MLARADVLYLALHDEPAPYVIPLNFAYAEGALWFHCAREGTKLDLIRRDPRVGFSAVADARIVPGDRSLRLLLDRAQRGRPGHGADLHRPRGAPARPRRAHAPSRDGASRLPSGFVRTDLRGQDRRGGAAGQAPRLIPVDDQIRPTSARHQPRRAAGILGEHPGHPRDRARSGRSPTTSSRPTRPSTCSRSAARPCRSG